MVSEVGTHRVRQEIIVKTHPNASEIKPRKVYRSLRGFIYSLPFARRKTNGSFFPR